MEKEFLQEPIDKNYIARLKGLLIILVIIGDFIDPMANTFNGIMGSFYRAVRLEIYSFHMMLFSFVSGFLSKNTEKRRTRAFQDLFLVYIIGQLFFGVLYFFVQGDARWLFDNLFLPGYGLWYLLSLFIWRMLLPDLLRFRKILIVSVLLTLGIGLFNVSGFLAMRRTLSFFVFFLLGYYAEPKHINAARKIPKVFSGGCFIVEFVFLLSLMRRGRKAFHVLFNAFTFACRGGEIITL